MIPRPSFKLSAEAEKFLSTYTTTAGELAKKRTKLSADRAALNSTGIYNQDAKYERADEANRDALRDLIKLEIAHRRTAAPWAAMFNAEWTRAKDQTQADFDAAVSEKVAQLKSLGWYDDPAPTQAHILLKFIAMQHPLVQKAKAVMENVQNHPGSSGISAEQIELDIANLEKEFRQTRSHAAALVA